MAVIYFLNKIYIVISKKETMQAFKREKKSRYFKNKRATDQDIIERKETQGKKL